MHAMQTRTPRGAESVDLDLSSAVNDDLRTPLAVLRASLEALGRGFESGDPRAGTVQRALGEVIRIGRHVQTLVDYALPQPARPLYCRIAEIAHSALEALTPERRSRVMVAVENGDARIHVDGPLVSRAIAHLVEYGLDETREPVLLTARENASGASFTVLHDARGDDLALPESGHAGSGAVVLGRLLARRDLDRLGGTCAIRRTRSGQVISEIRFDKTRGAKGRP